MRNILGYNLVLPILSEPKATSTRRQRLTNIIRHANTRCPYYKDKYTGFLEGEKDFTDEEFNYAFSHLPIINHGHLDAYHEDLCSDQLSDKKELFEHEQPLGAWAFLKKLFFKKDYKTSITISGTKARRWLDHHDIQYLTKSILNALKKNGWKRGQNLVAFMPKNSYFTNKLARYNSVLFHLFGLTIVPFDSINKDSAEQLLKTLKNTKAAALISLPHALLRIAQIMD